MTLRVTRQRLDGGLRVLVLELPHLHSVTLAFMVKAGPRFETPEQNGVSHMVEHLLLRGTELHPTSFALSSAIEVLGGDINGLTQRDAMTIHMSVPGRAAEAALGILGEIVTLSKLEGLDIERKVVLEELLDTLDRRGLETDPDALSRLALWRGHPLGMPVAGTRTTVTAIDDTSCHTHADRILCAENAVLCVVGPVDPQAILRTAGQAFAELPRGTTLPSGAKPDCPINPPIQIQTTDDAQATLLFSFPAPHENDPSFVKLLLLRRLLDDGFASRLRQEVCESRGLAYSLSAGVDAYEDAAAFDVEVTCAPSNVAVTTQIILDTLWNARAAPVSAEELARITARHRSELEMALDDPDEMASWLGATELMGYSSGYEDRINEAMTVTGDELTRLAEEILRPERCLLTVVGPARRSVRKLERLLGRAAGSTRSLSAKGTGVGARS
ncbi:MAG: insulinase family protein [Deltaproteobacteria bacterium]|nr:insulinase family protein [Deltaproteobacteria bacterium]